MLTFLSSTEVQLLSLVNLSILYQGPLKLPDTIEVDAGNPPLIKFSPDLKIAFIGNALLNVMNPDADPILLPLSQISETKNSGSRWFCVFSACSTYVALAFDPAFSNNCTAELHIFHFDMGKKTYTCCDTQRIFLPTCQKLTLDFHPHRVELILIEWTTQFHLDEEIGRSCVYPLDKLMSTHTLDLEKGSAIKLEHPVIHSSIVDGKEHNPSP